MSTKNSGKISIANYLSIAALAGLGVVSFFGSLLHSPDGGLGGPVFSAIALVVVLGALLFLAIRAKGADSNAEKWRIVEWVCLLLYIVVAVLASKPFLRFFYINSQKSDLQAQAFQETKAIRSLYQNYNQQCEQFIKQASEQIENYKDSKDNSKSAKNVKNKSKSGKDANDKNAEDALSLYVEKNCQVMADWRKKALLVVQLDQDKDLDEIDDLISNWSLMQLPTLSQRLAEKDTTALVSLKAKIAAYEKDNSLIPVVTGSQTEPYRLDGFAQFELGESPQPKFAEMLRNADGNTTTGWIVYALLHLLVLFNLLVAPRSVDVNPLSRNKQTGGLDL